MVSWSRCINYLKEEDKMGNEKGKQLKEIKEEYELVCLEMAEVLE